MKKQLATPARAIDADVALLDAVLACDELHPRARKAFTDMRVAITKFIGLTEPQRLWVQREAAQLGLPVPKPTVADVRAHKQPSAWEPGSTKAFKRRSRAR